MLTSSLLRSTAAPLPVSNRNSSFPFLMLIMLVMLTMLNEGVILALCWPTQRKDQTRYLERRELEPDRKRDKVSFPIQRLTAVDQQRVCFCFCLTLKLMRDYLKIINSYVMRNLMNLVYCQRLCFLCDIAELLKITLNFIFMESLRRICLGLL